MQADQVIAQLSPGDGKSFGAARTRAEALVWAARTWRSEQPRHALLMAQEAAAPMQPRTPDAPLCADLEPLGTAFLRY